MFKAWLHRFLFDPMKIIIVLPRRGVLRTNQAESILPVPGPYEHSKMVVLLLSLFPLSRSTLSPMNIYPEPLREKQNLRTRSPPSGMAAPTNLDDPSHSVKYMVRGLVVNTAGPGATLLCHSTLPGCVTLGKLYHLSVPQFPFLKMRMIVMKPCLCCGVLLLSKAARFCNPALSDY